MRQLHIIPIVHTPEDLGQLARDVAEVREVQGGLMGETGASIQEFWGNLRRGIEQWEVDHASLVIFQDSLPVTDAQHAGIGAKIVADLAAQGSQNHQIVRWLLEQGAHLEGTESPELMLAEYELMKRALSEQLGESSGESQEDSAEHEAEALELLGRRDSFIAERINRRLTESQIGMLFIGLKHTIEDKLSDDIEVLYPFGKPRNVTFI